jgi:hypothetical protein
MTMAIAAAVAMRATTAPAVFATQNNPAKYAAASKVQCNPATMFVAMLLAMCICNRGICSYHENSHQKAAKNRKQRVLAFHSVFSRNVFGTRQQNSTNPAPA